MVDQNDPAVREAAENERRWQREREEAENKRRDERKYYGPGVYFCPRCNQPCSSVGCGC